uniref:Uncharacterized protein n=1 Tax=Tetranychus urticae TaxID=32264 RepID=T1L6A1_TETUR
MKHLFVFELITDCTIEHPHTRVKHDALSSNYVVMKPLSICFHIYCNIYHRFHLTHRYLIIGNQR